MRALDANDVHCEYGVDGLRSSFDKAAPEPVPEPLPEPETEQERGTEPVDDLRPIDAFCREYTPLSYVVEPLVRSSALLTLTAKTGHGKTGLLVAMALAVSTGRPDVLGREVKQGRVLYLAVENGDDVRMRMMVTAHRHNINLSEIGDNLIVADRRLTPEDALARLRDGEWGPFTLVVADTFAAWFDGRDINDNVQAGEFMRRVRTLTGLPGKPAVIVAAHPIKNATADQLVPYGGGAILNEVDGNLTLSKEEGIASLHWQGKLRGLEFSPLLFRFDVCGSPDVVDREGRQVQIPVCVPTTQEVVEESIAGADERSARLLLAIFESPKGTLREWSDTTGIPIGGSIKRALDKLAEKKLIEKLLTHWQITNKGRRELGR